MAMFGSGLAHGVHHCGQSTGMGFACCAIVTNYSRQYAAEIVVQESLVPPPRRPRIKVKRSLGTGQCLPQDNEHTQALTDTSLFNACWIADSASLCAKLDRWQQGPATENLADRQVKSSSKTDYTTASRTRQAFSVMACSSSFVASEDNVLRRNLSTLDVRPVPKYDGD